MTRNSWPFPGSRWWKFDFHTHTPASMDTPWHRQSLALTERDWLLKYMAAEIDCVAVTDHNSGAWIDRLKRVYAEMKAETENGKPPLGFRDLVLFPGVEISVQGGVHVIAVFGPESTTSDIDTLLGSVGYRGTKGDSDQVTTRGIAEVIQEILDSGAIAIPAHADGPKGLLQCSSGTAKSEVDATTLLQALAVDGLLAVEWCSPTSIWPQCAAKDETKFAKVLGSDSHSFMGANVPGSRFTWVKMADATLEGLRLALLDSNGVSIRRSDDGAFDPFRIPAHVITAIEIERGKHIGNGKLARLACSPYFNAVVGGRGTGKSTVVHALRMAARRDAELPQGSEARVQFEGFKTISKGRDDKGAMRSDTEIRVEWQHDDRRLRVRWRADGSPSAVDEWRDDHWDASASQAVNPDRFPLRIFSQGQIAALAGSGRQTLLTIIDEAAKVAPLHQALGEARNTFRTLRSRLREQEAKLAGKPELERKLAEVMAKLDALAQTDQAAVLHAYGQAQQQNRDVNAVLEQLSEAAKEIAAVPARVVIDDWQASAYTGVDAEMLGWRRDAELALKNVLDAVAEQARKLDQAVEQLASDARHAHWQTRIAASRTAHADLQQRLAAQGVSDPHAFARLTQERQQLESQQKLLVRLQEDREALVREITAQSALMSERRIAITSARETFIANALIGNAHVRISVTPFGFEARQYERELRELIEALDERFAEDILDDGGTGGMAADLARASDADRPAAVEEVRQRLLSAGTGIGGRLRNYLQKKHEKPEFSDHILSWFPEDDLRIEYRRAPGEWSPIDQGSQGQRSAALLAFLLAFGEEPIVLDQPEDDLDNQLIYDLIVRQLRENKQRRQLIVVTHNPNVVVNGDAELVHLMQFGRGQCLVQDSGALQESNIRHEVCRVMEGGHEAFSRRWKRLGTEV